MWIILTISLTLLQLAEGFPINNKPIIGVLAQESFKGDPGATYIPAPYIKWLESAGARVVPVLLFRKNDMKAYCYYKKLFSSMNGILFPGGGVDLMNSQFAKTAMIFYTLAIQAKDKDGDFPQARKSPHRFPNVKVENEVVVNNFHPLFDRKNSLENYYFDFLNETTVTCN